MPRREAPEDAGLAAVGVDDPRAGVPEVRPQSQVGEGIAERMDRPNEAGLEAEQSGHGPRQGFEGALRSPGGAGDQLHLPIGDSPESQHRGEGVFLGPADDQAGDDMADPHGPRP